MQGRERAVVIPPLPRLCPKHILSAPQFLQGALFAFVLKQLMASPTLLCSGKVGISIASSSCARWGVSCVPTGLKSLVRQAAACWLWLFQWHTSAERGRWGGQPDLQVRPCSDPPAGGDGLSFVPGAGVRPALGQPLLLRENRACPCWARINFP